MKTTSMVEAFTDLVKESCNKKKETSAPITVKVTFDNGNTLTTKMNTDLAGAKKYYLNKEFNLGNGDKDLMAKAVKVDLLREDTDKDALKIARVEKDWKKIAKEDLKLEIIKGIIYAYGTELACLRLEHSYRETKKARAAYSTNLKTWYFSLVTI